MIMTRFACSKSCCRDTTVITFKDIEKRVHHTLSFRQCGGHQCTERKKICLLWACPIWTRWCMVCMRCVQGQVWQKCICTRRESPIRTSHFFSTPTRTKRSGWCRPGCCPPNWNRQWDVQDCCGRTAGYLSMPDSRWNRRNI